jgi:hypothetical protein
MIDCVLFCSCAFRASPKGRVVVVRRFRGYAYFWAVRISTTNNGWTIDDRRRVEYANERTSISNDQQHSGRQKEERVGVGDVDGTNFKPSVEGASHPPPAQTPSWRTRSGLPRLAL